MTAFSLPDSQTIHRAELDNGIVVLVYETPHTRSVVLNGSLDAGAIFEDQIALNGLASMTATALMRGTRKRDFDTLHSALEDIGADLNVSSGLHKVGFSGKALAEDFAVLVELLADVLREPTFPVDQVDRLRGERLTSLNYLQQDTQYQAGRIFREMLYPVAHPYHHDTRGTLQSLPTITADHLREFHAQTYGGEGLIITVAGAVNAAEVVATVAQYLGDWRNSSRIPTPILPKISQISQIQRENAVVAGKQQTDILIGAMGPSRLSPDYQAANLGNSILGMFGMMGRIGATVREREGLAYHAGSRVNAGFGPGTWRVSAGVDPKHVERAIELCIDEIRRFTSEPVTPEELDDNQSYFIGRLPLQLESNDGIAATLHSIETYGLGLDYLAQYRETIHAITADDLLHTAQKYLNPDALTIATAGPGQ